MTRIYLLLLLVVVAFVGGMNGDVNIEVAFNYRLTYQISAGQDMTTNQLVVEPEVIEAPAAKRSAIKKEFQPQPNFDNKKRAAQANEETGFSGDTIYNDADLESFVAMDGLPSDGNYYLLSTNSSIYRNSDRIVLKLQGCSIDRTNKWSASIDPVTSVLHVFNNLGNHYLVNINSGACTAGVSVQSGVSIVGVAYAVNTVSHVYSLYALDKQTNSFGALDPTTGVYHKIMVVNNRTVGSDFFDVTYISSNIKVVFAQTQQFYNFDVSTGAVSQPYTYDLGRDLLEFSFPPANITTGTPTYVFPAASSSGPTTASRATVAPTTVKATIVPTTASRATVAPTAARATAAPTAARATAAPTAARATAAPTAGRATAAPTAARATVAPTAARATAARATVAPTAAGICQGSVNLVARTGSGSTWTTDTTTYKIFDVTVVNSGTCIITAAAFPYYFIQPSHITNSWNLKLENEQGYGTVTLSSDVAIGASYAGAGLIVANYTTFSSHFSASPVTCRC